MGKKKFIPFLKKPIFILVEGEAEKKFFDLLKIKFRLGNIEIYVKSKLFFQEIKEPNKSGFFKLVGKQREETKYQDKGNIIYIVFDLKDEEQFYKLDVLENNIKSFSKSKFIKGGKIKYFYSNPCFEKILLILNGERNCLENEACKKLKEKFYGKKRTRLDKIEQLMSKLSKNDILALIDNYLKKCNIEKKDILFLIKHLGES